MDDVLIREEQPRDHNQVCKVHMAAFGDHGRVVVPLVDDLRKSLTTEQGLSLVALDDDVVVGHVMFTRNLLDAPERLVDVQVLSPIGVLPQRQRQGVGTSLIKHAIAMLVDLDVPAIFLEGPPDYYQQFGFQPGGDHGFGKPSLRIPDPAFQVRLLPTHKQWMTGTLIYRQAFWDHDAVGLRDAGQVRL